MLSAIIYSLWVLCLLNKGALMHRKMLEVWKYFRSPPLL